jgi:predicted ATPase with chaperone activity
MRTSAEAWPSLTLVGLPGAGFQDARERIRPAVESAGLEWPLRRVMVNLSPGTLRNDGPGLDLPIAMGALEDVLCPEVPLSRVAGCMPSGRVRPRWGRSLRRGR